MTTDKPGRSAVTSRSTVRLVPYAEREPLYAAYKAAREAEDSVGAVCEDCPRWDDSIIQAAVKAYEAKLIEQGRLLPTPAEVRTEFGAWCHGEDRNGIRLDQDKFASREQAARWGDEQIGRYGITGYRVMRREHHVFAEGSRFATAITAWAEDKEEER